MGGSLTEDEIKEIKNIDENIDTFVETGTYKADTTILASKYYKNIYTTEIHQGLHNESVNKARYLGINNINFLLGDSVKLLDNNVMPNISSAVFFIDSHVSGHDSSYCRDYPVPLLQELDVILNYQLTSSIFIFDDVRFWKNKSQSAPDWNHVSAEIILEKFKNKNIKVLVNYEKNDRFYVVAKDE